jgi:hypothetical protein
MPFAMRSASAAIDSLSALTKTLITEADPI